MTRSVWRLCLLLGLSACSLVEEESPALVTIWEVDDLVRSFSTIRAGSLDDERFYAIRERTGRRRALVAYDLDTGDEAWRQTIQGPCPVVPAAGRLFCPGDYLYALDPETGRILWQAGDGTVANSFQLVATTADADRVYTGHSGAPTADGRVFVFDAATGTPVWDRTFEGPGWEGIWLQSLTLSPEGDLLVAFSAEYDPPTIYSAAVLVAVDPVTGEERWRVVDGGPTTDRETGEIALWEDLAIYSDFGGQEAVAISRRTKEVVWRAPFTPGSFTFRRAPVVVDGVVYYTDTLGGVFAVDARSGTSVWSAKRQGGFFNQRGCGSILYADNQLGEVFDLVTGQYLGDLFLDRSVLPGQAAAADGVLYVSASTGVYAFDCTP